MSTPKENIKVEKIIDLLKKAEDDGTFYDSLYELYVLIEIAKGVNGINHGNSISLEELHNEMEALYESTSRRAGSTGTY